MSYLIGDYPNPGSFQPGLDIFESFWEIPRQFPNITSGEVAIDLETRDDGIRKGLGAGWALAGHGYIIGVAVAIEGSSWYFPVRHATGENLPVSSVFGWLREICQNENITKIFHNGLYDLGWLRREGVEVRGKIRDTMVAAPLLNENRYSYSLNKLGWEYLGEQKEETLLTDIAKMWKIDAKADMWQMPAKYVGEYASQDAALTLKLWKLLEQKIQEENLTNIFELETKVLPILLDARWRGIRIDLERAEKAKKIFDHKLKELLHGLEEYFPKEPDIFSNQSVAAAFDLQRLSYPRTEKGNPSFKDEWLQAHPHQLAQDIAKARKMYGAGEVFIQQMIINHTVDGRIHCELHQLKSEEGGTVSGRFSCTNPNLQQVPARVPEIATEIRSLFLPEEGCFWDSKDYSQQEPRLTVHFSNRLKLEGSAEAVEYYQTDPAADYHQFVAEMTGFPRKKAKTINLGLAYNMGDLKLCKSLGLPTSFDFRGREIAGPEAVEVFSTYHKKLPFIRKLNEYASARANQKGFIRTLEGRRCRFNRWEPSYFQKNEKKEFFDSEESAKKKFPDRKIVRAQTRNAMNRLIQSSAADQTKRAMVALYEEGAIIMLQIHDELALSSSCVEKSRYYEKLMEEICPLDVPSKVDSACGSSWGEATTDLKDFVYGI